MSAPYPIIVLVHGAWQQPEHYKLLVQAFHDDGFHDVVTPRNVTSGTPEKIAGKTHLDDVKVIHEAMTPYLDAGREVVLVAHSYGGVPGVSSLQGHTIQERAVKNLKGGVKGIVAVAAFVLPQKGLPLFQPDGSQYGEAFDVQNDYVATTAGFRSALFYGVQEGQDLPELSPQSRLSLETPTQVIARDFAIPKVYIVCEEDKVIPVNQQHAMAQAADARIVTIASGHSPQLDEKHSRAIAGTVKQFFV
ncbi:hypothetical protein Neosp_007945 [[Neocosmospora] mangrovei]